MKKVIPLAMILTLVISSYSTAALVQSTEIIPGDSGRNLERVQERDQYRDNQRTRIQGDGSGIGPGDYRHNSANDRSNTRRNSDYRRNNEVRDRGHIDRNHHNDRNKHNNGNRKHHSDRNRHSDSRRDQHANREHNVNRHNDRNRHSANNNRPNRNGPSAAPHRAPSGAGKPMPRPL